MVPFGKCDKSRQAAISAIKLFSEFSLNHHTGSYITVLVGKRGSVTTAVRGAEEGPDTDKLASRRDDTSLQGTATTTTITREAGGGVTMRVMLPRLIDTAVSAFNLAFLTATEAAAAS
ncbi:hypothetical protein BDBG_00583 [Blastomyces gilchristii SLH14081]|uniref:Uncharacterized protein n=1 Tax=Blastomyces gilchristii (strain SLH14081) TaxID=559298 RepID=A0A179U7Y3_BLAGS|nr:uncharacterized protein BDBG_00583 [Blastomyces gilchristii SLH14081]OAT03930.1 hypothetical protein BDBG_00583 [Blastomyces gilchristii SLH14081]